MDSPRCLVVVQQQVALGCANGEQGSQLTPAQEGEGVPAIAHTITLTLSESPSRSY